MAYTQKNNTGVAFKNDRQREGKNDPPYSGSAIVDGQAYWVSIWINNSKKDPDYDPQKKTYFSISLTPKQEKAASKPASKPAAHAAPPPPPPDPDLDPDLDQSGPDLM